MQTNIQKIVQGKLMEAVFDAEHKEMSIRYYEIADQVDVDYKPNKYFKYNITIRHNEGTDANELFSKAVLAVKKAALKKQHLTKKMKKQIVTFQYRDASNYKFHITRILETENGLNVDDEVDYTTIGITQEEFHAEIGYSYDEDSDHTLLDVIGVEEVTQEVIDILEEEITTLTENIAHREGYVAHLPSTQADREEITTWKKELAQKQSQYTAATGKPYEVPEKDYGGPQDDSDEPIADNE